MYPHPSADKMLYATRYAFSAAGVAMNVVNKFGCFNEYKAFYLPRFALGDRAAGFSDMTERDDVTLDANLQNHARQWPAVTRNTCYRDT